MPEHEDDGYYDRNVGENLRQLRLARGLNQEELARLVSERGVPFRQQTIVKIEKGMRPLRLREADALTDVLEVRIDALAEERPKIDRTASLIRNSHAVVDSWMQVVEASKSLLWHQDVLRQQVRDIADGGHDVDEHLLNDANTYLGVTLDHIAATAPGQYDADRSKTDAEFRAAVPYQASGDGGGDAVPASALQVAASDDEEAGRG